MSKARDIASAAPAPSTVSATELGYLDGVTSAIQTQLDAKTAKSTLTTTGDIYYASSANTPARLGIGTAGQVLKVNSGATAPEWAAPAAGGKVLQVVMGTTTTTTSISSTQTETDSGLSATITPSAASSKILVYVTQVTKYERSENQMFWDYFLYRASTSIWGTASGTFDMRATGATLVSWCGEVALTYLDSPNTTSATTYKTRGSRWSSSGTITFQNLDAKSQIILMEIGA